MSINKTIALLSKAEPFIQEDTNLQLTAKAVLEAYTDLPKVPTMEFPAEAVPIAKFDEAAEAPTPYGIKADIFGLFMEQNNLTDIVEARNLIGAANKIEPEHISLVFESASKVVDMIEEARRESHIAKRDARFKVVSRLGYLVDNLKKGKVSVVREPDPVKQIDFSDSNIVNINTTTPIGGENRGKDDPKRNPRKE